MDNNITNSSVFPFLVDSLSSNAKAEKEEEKTIKLKPSLLLDFFPLNHYQISFLPLRAKKVINTFAELLQSLCCSSFLSFLFLFSFTPIRLDLDEF